MVPPAVCWIGQPVALVDKIECSFNGVERQPGWSPLPAGERKMARISLLFPATQGKKSNSTPNPAELYRRYFNSIKRLLTLFRRNQRFS